MKKSFNRTLLGALALTLIIPAVAMAQNSDTESAQALANIIAPITLTQVTDLNFGDIVASVAGGTVTVTTAGAGSAVGVTLLGSTPTTAATFTVGGTTGRLYTLAVDPIVSLTGPGTAMNASLVGNGNGTVGTTNVAVGGTLTVGANQMQGSYAGTFNVTVTYQ